ncbi:MAG: hypothetical protein KGY38_04440 [Desulfobacterales bacterium]|nr:hypothetical protein [Desulfobacterales bacterium]
MSRIRMSFINNDFETRAAADFDLSDNQGSGFADFLDRIREDLETGETAWLEIEGMNRPVRLTVSESPDAM